jgi:hypothetical protein
VKLRAASAQDFATLSAQLGTVVGREPEPEPAATDGRRSAAWRLGTPHASAELHTMLVLEDATGLDARSGICEVGFWVRKGPGGEVESPYGRIVFTPIPTADVRGG